MALDEDIASFDLDPEAFKMCVDEGMSVDEVDEDIKNYRAFLQGIRDNPEILLAPSKRVDRVWHFAILDTQKYMADCQRLFGRYIHHFPYSGMLGDAEIQRGRFERTQSIIQEILSP